MKSKYYLLMLLTFMKCVDASGQGLDASPAGIMISHGHPKGGWMISYTYMNMMMKDNLSGTEKVNDDVVFQRDYGMSPQTMKTDMHMLMVMYGLTGRLSLMLSADYRINEMEMQSYSATHVHNGATMAMTGLNHTHHSAGLGDTKLFALYKLLNGEGSSLVLSMGISMPTGDYHVSAGEHAVFDGQRDSYMMQLGSGSFDLLPGITWLKNKGKMTWSAQVLSVIRPFDNPIGYHLGNEVTINGWAAYRFFSLMSLSLRGEGLTSTKIEGHDLWMYELSEPAANPANYGGQRVNGYAGINFYIHKSFMREGKIGIEFGVPLYQNLNGFQQAMNSMMNAGITKSF